MTAGPLVEPVPTHLEEQYARDGYVIVEDALTTDDLAAVHAEIVRLCRGELGDVGGRFEPDFESSDIDVMRKYLCIHMPHKASKIFEQMLAAPRIVDVLTRVVGPNVKAMQSMVFMKSEGKPGQAWHQDEFFIPTRDRSLTAAWIALDD
ncbi:MAG TPA: phytanoyl-CoA dioxygenase family protein, partial [Actinopolymorphaceae bacterium]